jgi:GSCFA family
MGSCFAENIGAILKEQLFDIQINPYGIVYNPISIAQQLIFITTAKEYTVDDLFEHNGLWHSWQHHGSFASSNQDEVLSKINFELNEANQKIKKADWLVITLGSAYYYSLSDGQIVSNCHKVPAARFEKKIASRPQIIQEFQVVFDQLKQINPSLKVLFNVSPVRYLRDGLTENTISKSILHLAINEMVAQNKNCFYFPSYEIVIDELRDYRFYKADLVHPNEIAIAYIYEKFAAALYDHETNVCIKEVQQFNAFSNHNILNNSEEAIAQYQLKKDEMMYILFEKYPFLESRYLTRKRQAL